MLTRRAAGWDRVMIAIDRSRSGKGPSDKVSHGTTSEISEGNFKD